MEKIFELPHYSVTLETERDTQYEYDGKDKDKAELVFKGVSIGDFDDREQKYGGMALFQKRIDKYEFVNVLDEDETIADFPIEDYYDSDGYYKLVEQGEPEEIDSKRIKGTDEEKDEEKDKTKHVLNDVVSHFKKKYPINEQAGYHLYPSYYFIVPIAGMEANIELRISDHSLNPSNIESKPNIVLDSELVRRGEKPKRIDISNEEAYEVVYDDDLAAFTTYKQVKPKNRYALLSTVIYYSDNETQNVFDNTATSINWKEERYDLSKEPLDASELIEKIQYEIDELIHEYESDPSNAVLFNGGGIVPTGRLKKSIECTKNTKKGIKCTRKTLNAHGKCHNHLNSK